MAHGGELLPGGCGAGLGRGEQEGLGWLVGWLVLRVIFLK